MNIGHKDTSQSCLRSISQTAETRALVCMRAHTYIVHVSILYTQDIHMCVYRYTDTYIYYIRTYMVCVLFAPKLISLYSAVTIHSEEG